jgi:ADP-heptose:LPS heptosyltransferase
MLRMSPADEADAEHLLCEVGLRDPGNGRPLVMLQPGARYWFKAWPAERFAELADRLAEGLGCRVMVGGNAAERDLAETVCAKARTKPVNLAGRTSLLVYAAVLKRCALFIGNDNGPMHIAAAVGTPVVALFGPSNPAQWGPRGGTAEVIYKGLDCRSCFHPACTRGEGNCMRLISVDEVFAAAGRLLTAAGHGHPSGQGRMRDGHADEGSRIVENLRRCGELTDLCLRLRQTVLSQQHAGRDAKRRLLDEIRQAKERAWRRNHF